MGLKDFIRKAARHRKPSIWRKILGWTCVILGLPGLILPIIPGIPLLVLGIVLLSGQHQWAHNVLEWAKRRFHGIHWLHLHDHEPHHSDPSEVVNKSIESPLDARDQP
jgi:hypothetical protein